MTAQLPFPSTHPLRTPPQLSVLVAQGPVHRIRTRVGDEALLVTDYQLVRTLLDDDRLGRSHPRPQEASRVGESVLFGTPTDNYATEKADHVRMRTLLQPHFSPRRMREFAPRVEQLTKSVIDDLQAHGSPADLNAAIATPLPILVICELLGVPYEDRDRFRAWSVAAADVVDPARSAEGLGELFSYGRDLVAHKRRNPGDDVISRLCEADGVSDAEIAGLSMILLFAGHETTVVQIGYGALYLLSTPGEWQALRTDPARAGAVVEEILRVPIGTNGGMPRWARTDFEIAGASVRAGDLVLLDVFTANHDPALFPDPERFAPDRPAAQHLTFGYGARYCLGAPLARMELQAVFGQLAARFADLQLAVPVSEVRFFANQLTAGVMELPVTW